MAEREVIPCQLISQGTCTRGSGQTAAPDVGQEKRAGWKLWFTEWPVSAAV